MHFYHNNMLVGVCRSAEKKNWSDFSFFVENMRLIRPLAEAKKHLKSWFLATFDILLMFQGLLSCLLLICSSKHIFWYQIYACTSLRSRFMAQKVSNLVIFVRKSDTDVISRLFSPLRHCLNHYVLLSSSSTQCGLHFGTSFMPVGACVLQKSQK